jgi:hypothetical protein
MLWAMGHRTWVLAVVIASGISDAGAGGAAHTSITLWSGTAPAAAIYGGLGYGSLSIPTGAQITERREMDVADGDLKISGIAATADPASVQLRSLGDPALSILEQRFVPGAATPDEMLARHIGDPVTVVTTKGDVAGVLRSVDLQSIVVEVGAGDQRRLQVMHRAGYVLDVRLPAGGSSDQPSLVWKVSTKKPGKQTVEVTYRATGMAWSADYLAVLDENARTLDFSAWATVQNQSGASYDGAQLTLVSGGGSTVPVANPYVASRPRQALPSTRFPVTTPVRIGNGESVQVELMPPRKGTKARTVVTYEAIADQSAQFQTYPQTDCTQVNLGAAAGTAEVAVEIDVPASATLPDGRVRMFRRKGDQLEAMTDDALHAMAGLARIPLSPDSDISGERHAACTVDERTRTIREKVDVRIDNKGKQAVDVVVREFLWRYPVWKIEAADESPKGMHAGPQTQEYRVNVPGGGKKTVTYTVVYSW